jgi:membrane protease YdiL (CAAX protease family)
MLVLRDVRWAFLLYVVGGCILGPWLLVGASPLRKGRGLPWNEGTSGWGAAAIAFLIFGPVFLGIYAWLQPHLGRPDMYLARLHELGWRDAHQDAYAVLFVLLIPWAEERWWRGEALPRLVQRYGPRRGVGLTAFGFAAYHWITLSSLYDPTPAILRWISIALVGWLWTWIAFRRGSWRVPYFAHLAADLGVVTAFFIFVRPTGSMLQ